MLFTLMEKTGREACFKGEMTHAINYLSRNVKQRVDCMNLNFQREIEVRITDLKTSDIDSI